MKKSDLKFIEKSERPWGSFFVIHDQDNYKLKRIEINSGGRLSYQFHTKRSEAWTIVDGEGLITLNDKEINVRSGDTILIPRKAKHRIENKSTSKLVFIEVQTGEYFGEDDITRIEDDYNRL